MRLHSADLPAGDLVGRQRDRLVLDAIAGGEVGRLLAGEGGERLGGAARGDEAAGDMRAELVTSGFAFLPPRLAPGCRLT
ncbi:MAG: hypothetical protein AB7Q23_00020 [Hyphomonadaceae bacterium]